jgi:hypothetical protein
MLCHCEERRDERNLGPPRTTVAAVSFYTCRSTINCLIAPIAFAGFRPFGHVSVQFMIV